MAIDGAGELAVCVGAKIADPSGAACVDLLRDLALRRLDLAQRYKALVPAPMAAPSRAAGSGTPAVMNQWRP
jgi:hypothetical protein